MEFAVAPTSLAEPAPPALSPAFWQLVRTRRSIRRYQPTPVPTAIVTALLTAATWAPSAHNRQPWRFCVVMNDGPKQELSRRLGERWHADLAADGADPGLHRPPAGHQPRPLDRFACPDRPCRDDGGHGRLS